MKALFDLFWTLCSLLAHLLSHWWFLQFTFQKHWMDQFEAAGYPISKEKTKRIFHHYSYASRLLVGSFLVFESGQKLQKTEKWMLSEMGAITALLDDLFDLSAISEKEVMDLLKEGKPIEGLEQESHWILLLEKAILHKVPNPELTLKWASEVLKTQVASIAQKNATTYKQQLKKISDDKGAASLLFYGSVRYGDRNERREGVLRKYGIFLQFLNDLFDVYKDLQEGIRTHVNVASRIKPLQEEFLAHHRELIQTMGGKRKLQAFLAFLAARGLVAFRQYLELEKKAQDQGFQAQSHSRRSLVVDMEKWSNLWQNMFEAWNFLRK